MNKWTWLVLVAVIALGGGYYVMSKQASLDGANGPRIGNASLNVEDFDGGDEPAELDRDAAGEGQGTDFDPGASFTGRDQDDEQKAQQAGPTAADIETIDDQDDPGETVKDPVTLEDKGDSPAAPQPTP